MSRRVKKPLKPRGDRPKGARPYRGSQAERSQAHRPGGKPARFSAPRPAKPAAFVAEPAKIVAEPPPLPTKVQTVVVTADENNMRVDRFLEARFPGLSFSHIQRIVRKGELRVNGKRADSKDRLEEGQNIRIPPLKLDAPKVAGHLSEAATKTLQALKDMILYEDADVMVLNKPAGLHASHRSNAGGDARCERPKTPAGSSARQGDRGLSPGGKNPLRRHCA